MGKDIIKLRNFTITMGNVKKNGEGRKLFAIWRKLENGRYSLECTKNYMTDAARYIGEQNGLSGDYLFGYIIAVTEFYEND